MVASGMAIIANWHQGQKQIGHIGKTKSQPIGPVIAELSEI
jgi:hypothetical protein